MNTAQVPRIRPAEPQQPQQPRRRFEIVTAQRKGRPKVFHAIVAVVGALAIVGMQLLISIWITGGQYRIAELQGEQRSLVRQAESLTEQLEIRGSTQYLGYAATSLGMIPARSLYTLNMSTGGYFALPGTSDVLGCAGGCGFAANELVKGLPLPQHPSAAPAVADAAVGDAAVAADTPTIPGGETETVDPNVPVAAETLPGVVTR